MKRIYNRITEVFTKKANRKLSPPFETGRGTPLPFGSEITTNGINFSIFSRHATAVRLLLFLPEETEPFYTINLDPRYNKTGDVWHVHVFELSQKVQYGYQIDGPYQPQHGHRYDEHAILVDPYTKALSRGKQWGERAFATQRGKHRFVRRSCVVSNEFDWRGDLPLQTPMQDSVIYEIHVRGFTQSSTSNTKHPGTFAGIIEKIPYLKSLGVTAVELMPISEFDENESHFLDPRTGRPLKNFWGYSSLAFFALKASFAGENQENEHIQEFKKMVHALHKEGIEVILDVVFNHTAEGNEHGPTISFKGLDNSTYYILNQDGYYLNFSGCGNTINCNHPLIRDLIIDCLHYWVTEMHVDGFRFDLASILGRDKYGNVLGNPPVIERIAHDPVLAKTKMIAEAWDAAGLYQVGSFPAYSRWAEWNGRYRDVVRSFVKGNDGQTWNLSQCIMGSPDLYEQTGRPPYHSINYITCHDGFTLKDLVSYNNKHNERNGEGNRDGSNDNHSWNCGVEGETDDPEVNRLRIQQMKNMLAILFLSQGVPMLLGGDEFSRTQQGNNNAYCQDNEISWIDWTLAPKNIEILNFTRELIEFRKHHSVFRRTEFFPQKDGKYQGIDWHGSKLNEPDWGYDSHSVAFHLYGDYAPEPDVDVYVAINAFWESIDFAIPQLKGKIWKCIVDTSELPPWDIVPERNAKEVPKDHYSVPPRSIIVLISDASHKS